MATFVLVHGATAGGWVWREVPGLIRQLGHQVYVCTLTGLGERSHLLNPDIDLDTHIQDVVNTIRFEDLDQVTLIGHSYGGAVITGVAEQIPERLSYLIYVDAVVLQDGEKVMDLWPPDMIEAARQEIQAHGEGWYLSGEDPEDPRFVDHPAKSLFQSITIGNVDSAALPHVYIFCTEKEEMGPSGSGIVRSAERAQALGWEYYELPTGHHPMWTMPQELVSLLVKAVQQSY
jgi:pimeloyl-ACP methyl ester carboxylesterase